MGRGLVPSSGPTTPLGLSDAPPLFPIPHKQRFGCDPLSRILDLSSAICKYMRHRFEDVRPHGLDTFVSCVGVRMYSTQASRNLRLNTSLYVCGSENNERYRWYGYHDLVLGGHPPFDKGRVQASSFRPSGPSHISLVIRFELGRCVHYRCYFYG